MSDVGTPDVGRTALELVDEAIDFADELGASAKRLEGGATVVDLGVEAPGGIDAGLLLATLRRGGLVAAEVGIREVSSHVWPALEATTDHPAVAVSSSTTERVGWWTVTGPALAGHHEPFAVAVAFGDTLPDAEATEAIADKVGVATDELYVATAAPGSVAWGVDAAAETLEASIEAVEGGADTHVTGVLLDVPVPPAAASVEEAVELAAACRSYGGRAHVRVADSFDSAAGDAISARADDVAAVTVVDGAGTTITVGGRELELLAEQLTR